MKIVEAGLSVNSINWGRRFDFDIFLRKKDF